MKIKPSELEDRPLDWAVAKCLGIVCYITTYGPLFGPGTVGLAVAGKGRLQPTTNWAQGGPIIEREKIQTQWETSDTGDINNGCWVATHSLKRGEYFQTCGPTPLIAAMRCFVASKFGHEIEIPDELI